MSRIVFVRDHPADIQHRYALISIDGLQIAKMKFGERVVHELGPGQHTIIGKNELGKTTELSVEVVEGEELRVQVGAVATGCFTILMWVFPPAPTITLEQTSLKQ